MYCISLTTIPRTTPPLLAPPAATKNQNMQCSIVCRGACQTTITTHPAQPAETRRQETGSRSSLLSIPQSAKTPKRDSSGSHMNASLLGKARLFDHQPGWRFCGSFERTVRDVYYRIDSMNCFGGSVCQQGACYTAGWWYGG